MGCFHGKVVSEWITYSSRSILEITQSRLTANALKRKIFRLQIQKEKFLILYSTRYKTIYIVTDLHHLRTCP